MTAETIQNWFVGAGIMIIVFIAGFGILSNYHTYDSTLDTGRLSIVNKSLDKSSSILSQSMQIESNILDTSEEADKGIIGQGLDYLNIIWGTIWSALKLFAGGLVFVWQMITFGLTEIGIPFAIVIIVQAIIVAIIGIAVIRAFLKI